jgi:hypothetical protein
MVPLADKYPEIALEWCYKKNCGWGPEHFSHASTVRAWWICPDCNREYKAQVNNRTSVMSGCPYCASKKVCDDNAFLVFFPAVSREWHPRKNGKLTPKDVMYASSKLVWWQCATCHHEWQARISDRTVKEACCPACYERRMEYARKHPRVRRRGHVVLNSRGKKVSRAGTRLVGTVLFRCREVILILLSSGTQPPMGLGRLMISHMDLKHWSGGNAQTVEITNGKAQFIRALEPTEGTARIVSVKKYRLPTH